MNTKPSYFMYIQITSQLGINNGTPRRDMGGGRGVSALESGMFFIFAMI